MALKNSPRVWSTRHTEIIKNKLDEAIDTLRLAKQYNKELSQFAEIAAETRITEAQQEKIISQLFPIEEGMTQRTINNIEAEKEKFRNCTVAVDLSPFYLTAWGLINAASDYTYHANPLRRTSKYEEKNMHKVFDGAMFLDKCVNLCNIKY